MSFNNNIFKAPRFNSDCILNEDKLNLNNKLSKDVYLIRRDNQKKKSISSHSNPVNYIDHNLLKISVEIIADCIAIKLLKIVNENKDMTREELYEQNQTCFYSSHIPEISVDKLFNEIIKAFPEIQCSTIIIIAIYIDRFCQKLEFHLTANNVIKLLVSALIVALKYNEKIVVPFKYFSKLCNISKEELIVLEFTFLELIHYKIFISDKTYNKRLKSLALMISKMNDNPDIVKSNINNTNNTN